MRLIKKPEIYVSDLDEYFKEGGRVFGGCEYLANDNK